MLGERAWLRWVQREAEAARPRRRPQLRLGIGDDAALIRPRPGADLVQTTDLFLEGVHFLRGRDSAAVCGRRAATRALSDLAAMGAAPVALLLSAAFPKELPSVWARGLMRGLLGAASEAGAVLAGGDVSASPDGVMLDVVGVGEVPAGRALLRSGARPGDRIFVSGSLGEAAWGRELAHGAAPVRGAAERRARARHLHPQARWRLGMALRGKASAAIDLSDGLAVDLNHLCEASGVGAEIDEGRLPAPGGVRRALYGGEDYELLLTVPPRGRLPAADDLIEIGRITRAPGCWLRRQGGRREPLLPRGWQHWS